MKWWGVVYFLCGGSDAGMHFDITHADSIALWEFIKVHFLLSFPISLYWLFSGAILFTSLM